MTAHRFVCSFLVLFCFVLSPFHLSAPNGWISFEEPGSSPKNVQVRPLSSTTMLIQWEEPDVPNGQVIVSLPRVSSIWISGVWLHFPSVFVFCATARRDRPTKCSTQPTQAWRRRPGTRRWWTIICWQPSATWHRTPSTRSACKPKRASARDRYRRPFRSRRSTASPASRPDCAPSASRPPLSRSSGPDRTTPAKTSTATNSTGTTPSPRYTELRLLSTPFIYDTAARVVHKKHALVYCIENNWFVCFFT